jgi:hypothetical protein
VPKRIVDGERLWKSRKLSEVRPHSLRAEFANLIPLAEANGSFECSVERVWAAVYSYNRPNISKKKVAKILDEFERVRMLFRWNSEEYGPCGYWVGIEKGTVLPPASSLERKDYKKGPQPPQHLLRAFLDHEIDSGLDPKGLPSTAEIGLGAEGGIGIGIGIGKGDGLGRVEESDGGEDRRGLGGLSHSLSPTAPDSSEQSVALYENMPSRSENSEHKSSQHQTEKELLGKLVSISGGEITFTEKYRRALVRLLDEWSVEQVAEAFRHHYDSIGSDSFLLKRAAKDFSEVAEQILHFYAHKRAEERRTEEMKERMIQKMQEDVARELAEAEAKATTEEQLALEEDL